MLKKIIVLAPLLAALGTSAQGAASICTADSGNIVQDCGFEAGTTSVNWSRTGNSFGDGVRVHSGGGAWSLSFATNFGAGEDPPGQGVISQILNTQAGATYDLSFWLLNSEGTDPTPFTPGTFFLNNRFKVSWGGVDVFALKDENPFSASYGQYTVSGLTAATSATELKFRGYHNIGAFVFDDVQVDLASGAPGSVPEPASWELMISGLGSLGAVLRRRRSQTRLAG